METMTIQQIQHGTATFEMNGKGYSTDMETLRVLQSIVPSAKSSGDASAVQAVMELGESTGRIKPLAEGEF